MCTESDENEWRMVKKNAGIQFVAFIHYLFIIIIVFNSLSPCTHAPQVNAVLMFNTDVSSFFFFIVHINRYALFILQLGGPVWYSESHKYNS